MKSSKIGFNDNWSSKIGSDFWEIGFNENDAQ